jgi:hypothetical protein
MPGLSKLAGVEHLTAWGAKYDNIQLHTGDPGVAGTTNIATESTRIAVVWDTPDDSVAGVVTMTHTNDLDVVRGLRLRVALGRADHGRLRRVGHNHRRPDHRRVGLVATGRVADRHRSGGQLMPDTTLYGLPYPAATDEPNGHLQIQALAEDVDVALGELQDAIDAIDGGGAPGSVLGGRWYATGGGQSIPVTSSGPGTVAAFGTEGSAPAPTGVTRTTEGSGHKFELLTAGLWHVAVTLRVASAAAAGEMSTHIRYGTSTFDTVLAGDGGRREGLARLMNPGSTRYLAAGTKLVVQVYNGTGSTRTLEPDSGNWVQIDLWRLA